MIVKGKVVAYFKVLFRHVPVVSEERPRQGFEQCSLLLNKSARRLIPFSISPCGT